MADEQRLHPCPLDECDATVEGVRDQPNAEAGPKIAEVLGVHSSFFSNQWLFQEAQRVEAELRAHLETHDIVEFVTEIVRLRKLLMTKNSELAAYRDTPCPRLCCSARS